MLPRWPAKRVEPTSTERDDLDHTIPGQACMTKGLAKPLPPAVLSLFGQN